MAWVIRSIDRVHYLNAMLMLVGWGKNPAGDFMSTPNDHGGAGTERHEAEMILCCPELETLNSKLGTLNY